MKTNFTHTLRNVFLAILLNSFLITEVFAQTAICENFDVRKDNYIESILQTTNGRSLFVMQAYKGLPIDRVALAGSIADLADSGVPDFYINEYVRLLYFSSGEYDDIILPVLKTIPFWLPDNAGNKRQYWSENHMIQWMASDWLLHQKYADWDVRPNLKKTLLKYLDGKIKYGFYEYFSYYNAFTMTALFNLYDFADDAEIKEKAGKALLKLLKDHMLMVNNQGGFYPTSGRYVPGAYMNTYYESISYLLTGLGKGSIYTGREMIAPVAMATSLLDLAPICNNWSEEENVTLNYGHSINEFSNVYNGLAREDRNTFQWSAGGYFSPELARETLWQLEKYDLWDHKEFKDFAFARALPPFLAGTISRIGATISRGSYIGESKIKIFKNRGVVLSSSQEKWKGRVGYQIYPVMANIENIPVFIRSGKVEQNVLDIPSRKSNEHMPYVNQNGNVALVMFRPNRDMELFGFNELDVALRWKDSDFDETLELGRWSLARKADSYVAVLKHCTEKINGIPACNDKDGQTWAIVVGNSKTHSSFDQFKDVIRQATYQEKWRRTNRWTNRWSYYGRVTVDGKNIEYTWNGDTFDGPADSSSNTFTRTISNTDLEIDMQVSIAPNPAKDYFSLVHMKTKGNQSVIAISVVNQMGVTVYKEDMSSNKSITKKVNTKNWKTGVYSVVFALKDGTVKIKKLVVSH